MSKYHLCKKSRAYCGSPYNGPSSDYLPAETDSLNKAILLAKELTEKNPVGWDIYDATTKQIVNLLGIVYD